MLATLCLAFFLRNAYTIDDASFLAMADHLRRDPLHPTAFPVPCAEPPVRVSSLLATGPVMAYLLVPAVLLRQGEGVAHLIQLAFLLGAIVATVSLARRLGLARLNTVSSGLVLAASPAVLAMTATAMPDVPAMALGIIGIERFRAWQTERRWSQGVAATLALGLAACARSHLLLLVGVGGLLLVPPWRFFRARAWLSPGKAWLPLLCAPLISLALMRLTRDPERGGLDVVRGILAFVRWHAMERRLVAFPAHLVLSLPFGLPWLALRPRAIGKSRVFWASVPAAAALLLYGGHREWLHWGIAPVAAGVGAAAVADVLVQGWRRDPARFALGVWLLLPLAVLPYSQMAPKYLIVCAPAVALLIASELRLDERWYQRAVLGLTCALGAGLGVAILQANRRYAEVDRRAATRVIAPAVARGERVWFSGSFGLYWYARQAGAQCLSARPPRPGELLLVGIMPDEPRVAALQKTWLGDVVDQRPGGRTMSHQDHAGFFADAWGPLPWAWGKGTLQRIGIYRVQ